MSDEEQARLLLALLRAVLAGDTERLGGIREILRMARAVPIPEHVSQHLLTLSAVDSELEDVPSGSARAQWAPGALREKDRERDAYLAVTADAVEDACRALLAVLAAPGASAREARGASQHNVPVAREETQTHLDRGRELAAQGALAEAALELEQALADPDDGAWRLEASLALGALRERLRTGGGPLTELRRLEGRVGHVQALAQLFAQAPGYFERLGGGSPDEEAAALFTPAPAGDQVVLGVYAPERLVGCAALVRGEGVAILGLLLIAERWQGRGIGTAAHRQLELVARRWARANRLRVAVVHDEPRALRFWRSAGYVELGPARPHPSGRSVLVLEKKLGE